MKVIHLPAFSLAVAGLAMPAVAELVTWEPEDYVQNGLVAMYDGIRNVGAALPHDPAATTWVDLSASGDTADLVVDKPALPGGWTSDGYRFDAGSQFLTRATPAFGLTLTAQLVMDAPMPPPVNEYFLAFNQGQLGLGYVWANLTWCNVNTKAFTGLDGKVIGPWNGQYLNVALDETAEEFTFNANFSDSSRAYRIRTEKNEIPAGVWSIGGLQGTDARDATGVVHSVRLYTRKLTDAELAQNRMVDEARFHGAMAGQLPVTNVVIEAAICGVSGMDASGVYRIRGSHMFQAVAFERDGLAYTPNGYLLRTWNVSTGTWDEPVVHSGNSFTWETGMPKVCLTWQWKVSGFKTWEPEDYVQNGLVAMYDGIRNVGATLPHDPTTTTWVDLSASGDAADLVVNNAGLPGNWASDGYLFAAGSFFRTRATPTLGGELTVQLATDAPMPAPKTENFLCFENALVECAMFWGGMAGCDSQAKVYTGVSNWKAAWDGLYWSGSLDDSFSQFTYGTSFSDASRTAVARTKWEDVPSGSWTIGGRMDIAERAATGVVHSVRMYTRKLTDAELARNRMVDEARFHGAMAGQLPVTNVVIGASLSGLSGTEGPGIYRIAGSHTFTASDCICGNTTYILDGCVLQTWDDATGAWRDPVEYKGSSYTWTEGMDNVRLTWKWHVAKGLRTVATFDVQDYVQDGLVAMYDGIRNVGAALPHDPAATTWVDLSASGDTADLVVDKAALPGGWTSDGYRFDAGSQFLTRATPAFGLMLTAQLVMDAPMPPPVNESFLAFGQGQANLGYVWGSQTWCNVNTKAFTGLDGKVIGPWNGQYLNVALDETAEEFTFNANFSDSSRAYRIRTEKNEIPAGVWSIGGLQGTDARDATGVVHSVRLYTRKLTDAELAQNRMVDEARFHGKLISTNVVVTASAKGIEGSEPAGAYVVEGEWTFTAVPVVREEGGRTVTYTPVGYALETRNPNGSWSAPVVYSGTSYVHSSGDAAVRLTWRWKSDKGLMLIFR